MPSPRLLVRNQRDAASVDEYICDLGPLVPGLGAVDAIVILGYSRDPDLLAGAPHPHHVQHTSVTRARLAPENRLNKFTDFATYLRDRGKAAVALADQGELHFVVLPPPKDQRMPLKSLEMVVYARPETPSAAPLADLSLSLDPSDDAGAEADLELPLTTDLAPVQKKRRIAEGDLGLTSEALQVLERGLAAPPPAAPRTPPPPPFRRRPRPPSPPNPRPCASPAPRRPRRVGPCYDAVDDKGFVWRLRSSELRLPPCLYYQDHRQKYQFNADARGLRLLEGLVVATAPLLAHNASVLEKSAADTAQRGVQIYAEKASLKETGITWTHEEYGHAGMQRVYLGTKCWQRFTETYNLCDRGTPEWEAVFQGILSHGESVLRVASLAGGPGFELWAVKAWVEERWEGGRLEMTSLDLQEGWDAYAKRLGFDFVGGWDLMRGKLLEEVKGGTEGGLHVVIISYGLIYFCTEKTADFLAHLLTPVAEGGGGVRLLLVSERSHVQPLIPWMAERGVACVRLMRQDNRREGIDERQLIFLPRGAKAREEKDRERWITFENVPFMKGT